MSDILFCEIFLIWGPNDFKIQVHLYSIGHLFYHLYADSGLMVTFRLCMFVCLNKCGQSQKGRNHFFMREIPGQAASCAETEEPWLQQASGEVLRSRKQSRGFHTEWHSNNSGTCLQEVFKTWKSKLPPTPESLISAWHPEIFIGQSSGNNMSILWCFIIFLQSHKNQTFTGRIPLWEGFYHSTSYLIFWANLNRVIKALSLREGILKRTTEPSLQCVED